MIISRKSLQSGAPAFTRWLRRIPAAVTLLLLFSAFAAYLGQVLGALPAWLEFFIDRLSGFTAVFLGIFIEAAPFLLLGTLASGVVEVFLDREDLSHWIPRQRLAGVLAGSLVGLFFPVCECGVVPFIRRLIHKGVPVPVAVSALLAVPVLNPIVIASTLAAFGPGLIFWGRLGLTLLIAVVVGLVFWSTQDTADVLRLNVSQPAPVLFNVPLPASPASQPTLVQRLSKVLLIAADEFFEMSRYLIAGALLAALMQTVIRQQALIALGQGPVLSVLVMVALAVLLSICSTVDAFIALAFVGAFTNGSILAFLVFGPMVDIKSTLMFLRVFKPRMVVYLIGLTLLMVLVVTVVWNLFGPGGLR